MEILNNFWKTISTPNDSLISIIFNDFGIPFIFIELTVTMLLFTTVLNIKTTKQQKITYVFFIAFISCISNSFLPKHIASISNLIISVLFIKLYFKTNLLKTLLSIIIPAGITVLLELLIFRLFLLFNIQYNNIMEIPIYRISITCLIYLVLFLLYRISSRFNININILDNINLKSKKTIIINLLFALVAIITQIYITNTYLNTLPLFVTIISFISLLVYFIISMYSLIKTTKLELTTLNLEQAQEYNKTLTILHDNIRGFKHDFNNMVTTIGGYIQTDDIKGLKEYYSELLDDCQRVNNLTTLSPTVINNPGIYNLLANKYHLANEKGIKINLEIFVNLNTLNIKIYELTKILGILLDNAIEATYECDNKIINFIIRKEDNKNRNVIIIENTYKDKNIDTIKIFEKGYSTKENNTGLGLWEVNQILRKNKNLSLFTTKKDEYFIQQLEIYNK